MLLVFNYVQRKIDSNFSSKHSINVDPNKFRLKYMDNGRQIIKHESCEQNASPNRKGYELMKVWVKRERTRHSRAHESWHVMLGNGSPLSLISSPLPSGQVEFLSYNAPCQNLTVHFHPLSLQPSTSFILTQMPFLISLLLYCLIY